MSVKNAQPNITSGERLCFLQGCPVLPHLFIIVLEMQARATRQEREIKSIRIKKKKAKLFAVDMILALNNPWNNNRIQLLEFTSEFSWWLNRKSMCKKYLYFINPQYTAWKWNWEKIPLIIASKWIKCLRVKLIEEVQDVYWKLNF